MTQDQKQRTKWTGDQWVGDRDGTTAAPDSRDQAAPDTARSTTDRWSKTQWVGDRGEGAPAPVDPAMMPEGETAISGMRQGSGEQHWAGDKQARREAAGGDPSPDR